MKIQEILDHYSELLTQLDTWYDRCQSVFPDQIQCQRGCCECCRSLFDITLVDAMLLKSGFDRLPDAVRDIIAARAQERLYGLRLVWPELEAPYFLNHRPEADWQQLMPEDDETPCVLLGDDGCCLLYHYRPMTCRLHGLPLVDPDGEIMHDEWCTLNFVEYDPLELTELREDFTRIFREEVALFRELEHAIFNKGFKELDTFIPLAVLVDYRGFDWQGWFDSVGGTILKK